MAFLTKQGQKVLAQPFNIFWVSIVKAKYFKNDVDNFFSTKKTSATSTAWKSIPGQRNLIKRGLEWFIGNSERISFWLDIWLNDYPLIDKIIVEKVMKLLGS